MKESNDAVEKDVVAEDSQQDGAVSCSPNCHSSKFSIKLKSLNTDELKQTLRDQPQFLRFVLSLKRLIDKKERVVARLKTKIKKLKSKATNVKDSSSQTDFTEQKVTDPPEEYPSSAWGDKEDGKAKSIAEQVAEVAQNALTQNGMVYVESAGMYYDYNTGYYYNSESGLYYHSTTGCYYYYSEETKEFKYHSHADLSGFTQTQISTQTTSVQQESLPPQTQELLRKKVKLRKHKQDKKDADGNGPTQPKRKKKNKVDKNATVKSNVKAQENLGLVGKCIDEIDNTEKILESDSEKSKELANSFELAEDNGANNAKSDIVTESIKSVQNSLKETGNDDKDIDEDTEVMDVNLKKKSRDSERRY